MLKIEGFSLTKSRNFILQLVKHNGFFFKTVFRFYRGHLIPKKQGGLHERIKPI